MRLIDHLTGVARIWATNRNRSTARLATIVINDGKFFVKVARGGGCTVATFEKFLMFFRDGKNWPDNVIPLDAAELLERLENIASDGASESPDKSQDIIDQSAGLAA